MKMKLALAAAAAIWAAAYSAEARDWTVDQGKALIGQHYWPKSQTAMIICQTPELSCRAFYKRQGFTVLGFVLGPSHSTWAFAQIRADDGTTGFMYGNPDIEWEPEDIPAAESTRRALARIQAEADASRKKDKELADAKSKRIDRCISGLDQLRIGMTEQEVRPIIACTLVGVNTTETAGGLRKQLVLHMDETWVAGYLYFEDGRLVAIQRRN